MKAVSNTTPLRYLIAIEQQHVLVQLFDKVFVPVAVHDELTDARTPELVRHTILSRPSWLEVRPVPEAQETAFGLSLHRGEREAIALTEDLRPDALLIDDQDGRTVALSRKLPVLGTLGVLEQADNLGLIGHYAELLTHLKASGFFITRGLEELLLQRHRARLAERHKK